MISNIVLSLIVAAGVTLGCIFLGMLLSSVGSGIAVLYAAGTFFQTFAALLGLIAGLWFFFSRTRV